MGVAAALAVALGGLAIEPPTGDAARGYVGGAPDLTPALADRAVALAARDAARDDLAQAATQTAERVVAVRAKAAQVQLPGDRLTALDQLERQVDALVAQVEADRLDGVRPSRSGERAPGEDGGAETAAPSDEAVTDEAGAAGAGVAGSPAAEPGATVPEATEPGTAVTGEAAGSATGEAAGTLAGDTGASSAVPEPAAAPLPVADPTALSAALPAVAADDDPTAAALRGALLALVEATNEVDAAADAAAAAAAAAAERAAWKRSLQGYANGRIPASALCSPSFDSSALLRCDAAEALTALDAAYVAAFGGHLQVSDSYRSYGAQVACRRSKGSLCARPGTSNHGWGVAVDLGGPAHSFGTAAHAWLLANAGAYGWTLPAWARADGSKPEPWHWEYVG